MNSLDSKLCELCRKDIPKDAIYCSACNSYQDWRKHFKLSSVVLSLLVALVAVLGSSIQSLSAIWPDSPSNIAISEPVFYKTTAHFVVTNSGDVAGSLEDGFISAPNLKTLIKLDPVSPAQRLIKPGVSQIAFSTSMQLKAGDAIEARKSISRKSLNKSAGNIELAVRNSAGDLEEINVSVSRYELFKLLTAHIERCLIGETKETLLDGCDDMDKLLEKPKQKL